MLGGYEVLLLSVIGAIKQGKELGDTRRRGAAWYNFKLRAKERLTKVISKLRPKGGEGANTF